MPWFPLLSGWIICIVYICHTFLLHLYIDRPTNTTEKLMNCRDSEVQEGGHGSMHNMTLYGSSPMRVENRWPGDRGHVNNEAETADPEGAPRNLLDWWKSSIWHLICISSIKFHWVTGLGLLYFVISVVPHLKIRKTQKQLFKLLR
jgi:hypothetical protein